MLRHILVLFAVTSITLAAVARQPLEKKPDEYKDCDGCWVSAVQHFIPIGESFPVPNDCAEYRCTETEVLIVSCGAVQVSPPCFLTVDESQTYPGCCPQGVCPTTGQQPTES